MQLHQLKAPRGARKRRKIVGRGDGSGHGKTSGRGENGQRSRSGRWVVGPHEGGQSRLIRRLPKMGFRSHRPILNQVVNVSDLNRLKDGTTVNIELLKSEGLVGSVNKPVKILGNGEIKKKLTIQVTTSKSAKAKIEKAGGKVELIDKQVDQKAKTEKSK